jgi:retron-type reverse transcriptase
MIPHDIILEIIGKKITCNKTMQLIRKTLKAGYIDPDSKQFVKSDLGTPQGSILSPLLANIVLNELDQRMDRVKSGFEKGKVRSKNKVYNALTSKIQNLKKSNPGSPQIRELAKLKSKLPSVMINDPNFKRMMYLRYADDFVVLIAGSSDDAHKIRG